MFEATLTLNHNIIAIALEDHSSISLQAVFMHAATEGGGVAKDCIFACGLFN